MTPTTAPLDRLAPLVRLHDRAFGTLERATAGWLPGLAARVAFAAVLFLYFWSSALTKLAPGPLGLPTLSDGAYVQILPSVMEAHGYDASAIPTLPWGLIVLTGTVAEFVLPVLIVLGLATRLAALGMIGFVAAQTYVDVAFHGVDAKTVGALFDRFPDAPVADQRALWLVPLIHLVVRGAGALSLDAALARRAGVAVARPVA